MKTSDRGIAFIKEFEELRLEAYLCSAGRWTIGWGSTKGVKSGMKITEEEAIELLAKDLAKFETSVNKLVKVPLTQGEYDALVSFDFNTGGLAQSTLLRKLNSGDRAGAANEFLRWDKETVNGKKRVSRGLARRRRDERAMFLGRTA